MTTLQALTRALAVAQAFEQRYGATDTLATALRECEADWETRHALGEHQCGLPETIMQALNSGDGVYRP